jgi:hypothetical protein
MRALEMYRLRLAVVVLGVTALVTTTGFVPFTEEGAFAPQAWAGSQHHDDDDDDDDGKNHNNNKKNVFDHFACYRAAEHVVDKDVQIINQFTFDDKGKPGKVTISVGELELLCVPTQKILIKKK